MFVNDWLDFIEKVIGHVAWPLAVFWTVLLFRGEISQFLKRIQKATFKGVALDLSKDIEDLKNTAIRAGVTVHYPRDYSDLVNVEQFEQAPEWAFIQSWQNIEETLRSLKPEVSSRQSVRMLINEWERDGEISSEIKMILEKLSKIRNKIVHQGTGDVTRGEVLEWLGIAKSVNDRLKR